MTLPPIFGVEESEKTALVLSNRHFGVEKADFWPPEGLFSGSWPDSAGGVKNGVIWVKKSTSGLLVQKWVLKVGEAEKRVFTAF